MIRAWWYEKQTAGFTLVELLVVLSVIALLVGTVVVSFGDSGQQGRDLERQSDLRAVAMALESYKRREGSYPSQPSCGSGGWATEEACGDGYINDLWPQYIDELPQDPRRGDADGYSYRTNGDGSVFKLMARGTVESETVTSDHSLAPCDMSADWCESDCNENSDIFQTSYAVWGGFADEEDESDVIAATRAVICQL